jgi:outer membrane receptor protein involved in Fe transport
MIASPSRRAPASAGCFLLFAAIAAYAQTPNPPTSATPPAPSNTTTPEPVHTSITVTEHVSAESPADISVLSADDVSDTPGVDLDDRLRMIPGFSLYKRSSSEVANPTTQGISLRGIGSSGSSRTLLLFNGVPYNDPFGGWVYWTRFTPEDIEEVEVSRGASTSLFGNLAMGGAINIFPVEPAPSTRHVSAGFEAGTQNTYDAWADYTQSFQNFAISGSGRGFTTDGFYIVPEDIRGKIDRPANVRFVNDTIRLDWFNGPHRIYAWINSVVEERGNGTVLTHNSTAVGTGAVRYLFQQSHDAFSVTGFGTTGQFHSTYSSASANRNTETLVEVQHVPESALGASAIYTHSNSRFDLNAGTDVEQDRGFSYDRFSATNVRVSGGSELEHGEFIQGDLNEGPFKFFAGARQQFTGQDGHQFFSPSAGFAVGKHGWRGRGSVYRAFRAPTLNELYRQFRVGNTTTLANPNLQPETNFGAEIGADYLMEHGALRVTAFRNDIHDLITNTTLSSTPTSITRERENGPPSVNRGVEVSLDHRWHEFTGELGYLFADSHFVTGLRVPEVPRSTGSATLRWAHRRTMAAASVRATSSQFDDDLNQFLLPGFAVVQLLVRQQLFPRLTASVDVTNLLNRTFYTAFTPTPNIGDPRIIEGGLIWKMN